MPNTGENITSSTGESTETNLRAVYEKRGQKTLSAMTTEELLALTREELEQFSIEELQAGKARLEAEYEALFGVPYQPVTEPTALANSEVDVVDEAITSADNGTTPAITAEEIITSDTAATNPAASSVTESSAAPVTENGPAPSSETISPEEARAAHEKAKRKPSFKGFARAKIAPYLLTATLLAGGIGLSNSLRRNRNKAVDDHPPVTQETVIEDSTEDEEDDNQIANLDNQKEAFNELAGELPNGVTYDYTHYADRDNKESYNAFDYDMSGDFNDVEKTKEHIMDIASDTPEALAAFSYCIFNESEKNELGIGGMTANEIDDYMSNREDGGAMQKRLLAALDQVLKNEDTIFNYYYENDTEKTFYIYFVDDNENGKMDPGEVHLAYDIKNRNNAEQVDIFRSGHKVLDLNMLCGYQPNFETPPEGVPRVKSKERTTRIETGDSSTEDTTPNKPTPNNPTPNNSTPDNPTNNPIPDNSTPDGSEHTPKNEEKQKENADDADQRELDQNVTPPTTEEQDKENFKAIEEQKEEDKEKENENEKTAKEQAQKESEASHQAEERREQEEKTKDSKSEPEKKEQQQKEQKADESAEKAKKDASKEQDKNAGQEKKATEEKQTQEKAQVKVNDNESKNEKEAEAKKGDNKEGRAKTIEEVDY